MEANIVYMIQIFAVIMCVFAFIGLVYGLFCTIGEFIKRIRT